MMLGATSSINNYPNIFGLQSGQSMEQLAQTLATTSKKMMPTDTLTISSSANMIQQFLNSDMQGNAEAGDGEFDLMGLAQLKQRGEMLAGMLQLKMKDFESHLTSSIQGAGLPMQDMDIKEGEDGLFLMGNMPNKESIQNALGGLQGEFMDISRLAEVLNMLKQPESGHAAGDLSGLVSSAAKYAQQSLADKSAKLPESDFVMHVTQSGASFTFE